MNAAFPHASIYRRARERGQEDNWKRMPGRHEAMVKLEAVYAGHHDVHDGAGYRIVETVPVKKGARRLESSNVIA